MFEIETLPKNLLSQADSRAQQIRKDIVFSHYDENMLFASLDLNSEGALKDSKYRI